MDNNSKVRTLPRIARRSLGLARQFVRDLSWHARYRGAPFPSRWRRVVEQGSLLISNAITGEDYYNCALYRTELPPEHKKSYVGGFEKHRYFNKLNLPVYDIVARDKVLFHHLAVGLGLCVPEILATVSPPHVPSAGLRISTRDQLRTFLAGEANLFLKPADGSLGEGALALGERAPDGRGWRRLPSSDTIDVDDVLAHAWSGNVPRRFVVQRLLHPHPEMAAMVPDVLPTVRIMTLHLDKPVVLGAGLRLGSGDTPTDNFTGGGVIVAVAPDTGCLGSAVQLVDGVPQRRTTHPVTGATVTGRIVPDWHDVVALALEGASKLPFLPCLAWDIGISSDGPIIVETNTRPGCRSVQLAADRGLLDGPLGVALQVHSGLANAGIIVPRGLHMHG